MLTFENVLEIFHEYLLHDPEEEVLPCKRFISPATAAFTASQICS